jgi:methyl-accepting chemotaxis protein
MIPAFGSLGLGKKIAILSSMTLLSLLLAGTLFFMFGISQQRKIDQLVKSEIPRIQSLNDLSRYLLGAQAALSQLINRTNAGGFEAEQLASTADLAARNAQGVEQVMPVLTKAGVIDKETSLTAAGFVQDVRESLANLAYDAAFATINAEWAWEKYTAVNTALEKALARENASADEFRLRAEAEARTGQLLQLAIILTAAIVNILLSAFLGRLILRPLQTACQAIRTIAEGDLTQELAAFTSSDELGRLIADVSTLRQKMSGIVSRISEESDRLIDIGDDLTRDVDASAAAVQQVVGSISTVKEKSISQEAGVTETNATVREIVAVIKSLDECIENQSACVEESSSSIEELVANVASVSKVLKNNACSVKDLIAASEEGKQALADASALVQEIARDSENLLEAGTVIQSVANQTNLLAMNAAIEAAHAGESGRGFSVVADEIRKLAEDSSEQGKSITQVLERLKEAIDKVANSSLISQERFEKVFELAKQVTDQESIIMDAMGEQSAGGGQVLEAMAQINKITSQVRDGSAQMLTGSKGVLKEMERLTAMTHEITDRMNEMSGGTCQITAVMEKVSGVSQQNREGIAALKTEVSSFKLSGRD